jgi:hypothetical protein
MWDKFSKMQGAVVLAVIGTAAVLIFTMVMAGFAAAHGKWDMADKWLMLIFTQVGGAFMGFLYMKSQSTTKTTAP